MSSPVSQILAERYSTDGRPGANVECLFCHHRTFCIKRDDTLGKCFHPSCGKHITSGSGDAHADRVLDDILDRVFDEFHRHLLSERSPGSAYACCVDERRIHPQVVADSMLGAVPANYDVNALFESAIATAEEAARAADGESSTRARRSRGSQPPQARERLGALTAARDKLRACVSGHTGWLALFYTDAAHHVTAIRFRRPYAKDFLLYKPGAVMGVFNHGLFSPNSPPDSHTVDRLLLVVEGEFNVLQLQSLCARHAELEGKPPEHGYVFACAVGGVHNTDAETIKRLSSTPIVCADNDRSNAGFALVEKLRAVVPVRAFTTPKADSDLDDFIREFGEDVAAAHAAVKALVRDAKVYCRPYGVVKDEVDAVRRREGSGRDSLKRFDVHRGVADLIVADLEARGCFYNDGSIGYVFLSDERLLVPIERDSRDLDLILSRYGMLPVEDVHRHVLDALRLRALEHGLKTEVHTLSYYDRDSNRLYVFNLKDRVYRITVDGVEVVDNGTDRVLFVHNPAHKSFTLVQLEPGTSPVHECLIAPIRFAKGDLAEDEQRVLFLLFFYSLFFPELFPTKPILAMIGERGCGKTSGLRKIGRLLFGPSFNVMPLSDDSRDFDAAITHEHFVAIDNVDSHIQWLDDRLALAATGGTIKRRELYTTNRVVEFPLRAFIGLTSRTPHFRREDVADRLLIFPLDRFDAFLSEATILSEFDKARDRMMTEVVGHLQEILQALGQSRTYAPATHFRMADFATFALKVAHAQGWEATMASILERLTTAQSSFVAEDNPIIDALDIWLSTGDGKNVDREITSRDLCAELFAIAQAHQMGRTWDQNTRSFAQRLRTLTGTLHDAYGMKERHGKGRTRFLSFHPKGEEMP